MLITNIKTSYCFLRHFRIASIIQAESKRYLRNKTSTVVKWYEKGRVDPKELKEFGKEIPEERVYETRNIFNQSLKPDHKQNYEPKLPPRPQNPNADTEIKGNNKVLNNLKQNLSANATIDSKDTSFKDAVGKKFNKIPVRVLSVDDLTPENQFEMLSYAVTPMWQVPYNLQLNIKYRKYADLLKHIRVTLKDNKQTQVKANDKGMLCDMAEVQPSPVTHAYRNKDEFNVWDGVDGNPKTVGFFVGSPATKAVCVPADMLINTKDSHKLVASRFQEYIRASPYGAYKSFRGDDSGIYRNILVRSNIEGELMVVVKIHPKQLTGNEIENEMNSVKDFFMSGPGQDCNISSLYFQAALASHSKGDVAPFRLLAGKPHLYETIFEQKFRISPDTFLQVNTAASEILYSTVKELVQPTPSTTLLDVCCGTGIISLVLSPFTCRTIGIELVKQAIEDAKHNASVNKVRNATFLCGAVEKMISQVTGGVYQEDIVVVLNPDRGGLDNRTIRAIRSCRAIRKVVYISCLPEGNAMRNFISLCKSERTNQSGPPFVPILAAPVDMFPHTNHCELVILMERFEL